ncbi:MAG: TonB-dependent receptor plug domain-containing protein [Chitinophagaceae bacterium]|nr:TonB-dependent receptor plug domain-containing protein [Chitinophagaceae bacterium]
MPVAVVDPEKFAQSKSSLLTALNTVPGVRMEERSPGSYRISIRGSSLRSPFGVRNIKVYWNDIAVTDPGGNTYFNQFAANNFTFLEVVKGPAASMYGAGTGGLILLNSFGVWKPGVTAEINGGSYGTLNIFGSLSWGDKEHKNMITGSRQQSDGYRDHTVMHRDNFSWSSSLKSGKRSQTDFSLLYTNLYYQTPGALTLTEYKNNPRASRPAAGGFPSARNARRRSSSKIYWRCDRKISFSNSVKNTTTVYGYFTDFKNPAVRNYEQRKEPSWGGRTNFNVKLYRNRLHWILMRALSYKQACSTPRSPKKKRERDTLQTNDDIKRSPLASMHRSVILQQPPEYFLQGQHQLYKSVDQKAQQFSRSGADQKLPGRDRPAVRHYESLG